MRSTESMIHEEARRDGGEQVQYGGMSGYWMGQQPFMHYPWMFPREPSHNWYVNISWFTQSLSLLLIFLSMDDGFSHAFNIFLTFVLPLLKVDVAENLSLATDLNMLF